jgi:hypothetical protein
MARAPDPKQRPKQPAKKQPAGCAVAAVLLLAGAAYKLSDHAFSPSTFDRQSPQAERSPRM